MKHLIKIFCLLAIMHFSIHANAQWQPSVVGIGPSMVTCFIESSGVILAGTFQSGIYRSTDNGISWAPLNTGLDTNNHSVLCFGKNSAGIFAGIDTTIYFSNNNGTSWSIVNNSGSREFAFLSDTVYAASFGTGILMSTNNGISWVSMNAGITTNKVTSVIAKGHLLFAGTANDGIFVSSNSGISWSAVNTGLSLPVAISCLATNGNYIYAGTGWAYNPVIISQGMYISSDNGASWAHVTNGIPVAAEINDVTKAGNTMLVSIITSSKIKIYRSADHGATWSPFMNGIDTSNIFGVVDIYEATSYMFCGLETSSNVSIYRIDKNEVLSINEQDNNRIPFSIYPNPTNQNATLEFDNSGKENCILKLYDIQGQLVRTIAGISTGKAEIERKNLTSGLYFFQLQTDNEIIATGKFIIE
jgi:photosystem II stability/assembly factor-like uncharacterized protein